MISEQTSPVEMFAVLIEIKLDGHVEISGDFEREKNSLWKMGFTVISFFFLKNKLERSLLLFVHFFRYICSTACECKHLLSQTYERNPVQLGI